jgi:hypothetical protein
MTLRWCVSSHNAVRSSVTAPACHATPTKRRRCRSWVRVYCRHGSSRCAPMDDLEVISGSGVAAGADHRPYRAPVPSGYPGAGRPTGRYPFRHEHRIGPHPGQANAGWPRGQVDAAVGQGACSTSLTAPRAAMTSTPSTLRRLLPADRCTSGTPSPTARPTSSRASSACAARKSSTRSGGTTTA